MKEGHNDKLPVIDDPDLRKKQLDRFVGGVEEIGNYFKETKKQQKLNLWLSVGYLSFILLIIIVVFGVSYWRGGFDGIVDKTVSTRHFNCTSGNTTDDLRSYTDAEKFLIIYGGECRLYHKFR